MKYRVMRIDNLVDAITKHIQKKYFPRINKAALLNEFVYRHYKEHFPEIVEEEQEREKAENNDAGL